MALLAFVESLLWRLPGDGILLLIPFDHRQGQGGAHDILAQGSTRILVIEVFETVMSDILLLFDGKRPLRVVNPEVFGKLPRL